MKEQIEMLRKVKVELEKEADKANQEGNTEKLNKLESAIINIRRTIIQINDIKYL